MPDQGPRVLYRLRDHIAGANWRPTRFAEAVPNIRICGLCRMIPKRTVALPCSHVLCESCHKACTQDGGGVCPLDGDAFADDECGWTPLSERKAKDLKAHCWNEDRGCNFVGNLQAVLQHFEEQCGFHEVACPRCGDSVLNGDLPPRYEPGCSHEKSLATPDTDSRQGSAAGLSDVSAELREINMPLNEPLAAHHAHEGATVLAMLLDLETGINELVEVTQMHDNSILSFDDEIEE
ncbi:uncharacterized protein LOC144128005 isoform X2 [Amblyomma americanum]